MYLLWLKEIIENFPSIFWNILFAKQLKVEFWISFRLENELVEMRWSSLTPNQRFIFLQIFFDEKFLSNTKNSKNISNLLSSFFIFLSFSMISWMGRLENMRFSLIKSNYLWMRLSDFFMQFFAFTSFWGQASLMR